MLKKDNLPLVSIQIPTYNQKDYIIETVTSVLKQTHKPLEIIISDDNSEYNIKQHLKDLDNILININNINIGRVNNYRHSLYNYVNGKYFINLDGDDYFTDKEFINYGVNLLEKTGAVIYEANHNLDLIKKYLNKYIVLDNHSILVNGVDFLKHIIDINCFTHASCIFNTKLAKKSDFYTIDSLSSDFNSACKLYLEGKIIISNKEVFKWRQHKNNATWSVNISHYFKDKNSYDNILNEAIKKMNKDDYSYLKDSLYLELFKRTVYSFYNSNDKLRIKLFFLFKHTKFDFSYFKVLLSLIKNIIQLK